MLLQDVVTPPPAPTPAPAPFPVVAQGGKGVQVFVDGKSLQSPQAIYQGMVHQRDELGNQMERLTNERRDITNRLSGEQGVNGVDKAGLEKRLGTIDARIDALDKQIAQADAQVASAAAIPGAIVERPPEPRQGPPEEVFVLSGMFIVVVFFPLSVALARRIWKRGTAAVAALPHDIIERFTQIDQAVESIAVEVERIGEGQRFITRVLSEQGRPALAEPASRGVEVRARPNG